jgi:hypothetical protein
MSLSELGPVNLDSKTFLPTLRYESLERVLKRELDLRIVRRCW